MFRLCEACNGGCFNVVSCLIKNLHVKTVLSSYYLKLSLLVPLECLLIFVQVQSHVSYRYFSYKGPRRNPLGAYLLFGFFHWGLFGEIKHFFVSLSYSI